MDQPELIQLPDFDRVALRVGTVTDVRPNKKSRNPAYVVTLDFGPELGVKKSSAQITDLYSPEDLLGRQLICCVNLTPMHIGSVKSEVRILGADTPSGVALLPPDRPAEPGSRISGPLPFPHFFRFP